MTAVGNTIEVCGVFTSGEAGANGGGDFTPLDNPSTARLMEGDRELVKARTGAAALRLADAKPPVLIELFQTRAVPVPTLCIT